MTVVNQVIAWGMFVAGIIFDIQVWRGKVASDEPPFVLHLSTWALIYSAYTTILVA